MAAITRPGTLATTPLGPQLSWLGPDSLANVRSNFFPDLLGPYCWASDYVTGSVLAQKARYLTSSQRKACSGECCELPKLLVQHNAIVLLWKVLVLLFFRLLLFLLFTLVLILLRVPSCSRSCCCYCLPFLQGYDSFHCYKSYCSTGSAIPRTRRHQAVEGHRQRLPESSQPPKFCS